MPSIPQDSGGSVGQAATAADSTQDQEVEVGNQAAAAAAEEVMEAGSQT